MKRFLSFPLLAVMLLPAACVDVPQQSTGTRADSCGASKFQSYVGGPSRAILGASIPGSSRHYGRNEAVATNVPTRLNFVHSVESAADSVINPQSKVVRVFCG